MHRIMYRLSSCCFHDVFSVWSFRSLLFERRYGIHLFLYFFCTVRSRSNWGTKKNKKQNILNFASQYFIAFSPTNFGLFLFSGPLKSQWFRLLFPGYRRIVVFYEWKMVPFLFVSCFFCLRKIFVSLEVVRIKTMLVARV